MIVTIKIYDSPMSEDGVEPDYCCIEVVVKKKRSGTEEFGRAAGLGMRASKLIKECPHVLTKFLSSVVEEANS